VDSILIRTTRAPDDAVLERLADVVALVRTAAEHRLPAPERE
jgi:hypothetical protein